MESKSTCQMDEAPTVKFERKLFLERCAEWNILLEGLVAVSVINQTSLTQIFLTDRSRVQFFDERGDVESVVNAMRSWCNSLRGGGAETTQRQRNAAAQTRNTAAAPTSWCDANHLSEAALRALEDSVMRKHRELIQMCPHLSTVSLRFNKDVEVSSRILTELLCDEFHESICVYSGHPRLGYYMISTKQFIQPSHTSYTSLMNKPPLFTLLLKHFESSREENDSYPFPCVSRQTIDEHLFMTVDEVLADLILRKYFSSSSRQIIDEHAYRKFTIHNVGLVCGARMHASDAGAGNTVLVLYDAKCLALICYHSSSQDLHRAKALVHRQLTKQRNKLSAATADFPYPYFYCSLRIHLKAGFICTGLLRSGEFGKINVHKSVNNKSKQHSDDALVGLVDEVEDPLIDTIQFETYKSAMEFFCGMKKHRKGENVKLINFIPSIAHDMIDNEIVSFQNKIVIKATLCELNVRSVTEEYRVKINSILEKMLDSAGIQMGLTGVDCSRLETFVNHSFKHIDIRLTCPNSVSAQRSIDVLEAYPANKGKCLKIQCRKELDAALKFVIFDVCNDAYASIGKDLGKKLQSLQTEEKILEKYHIQRISSTVHRVTLTASSLSDVDRLRSLVETQTQPKIVKVQRYLWLYLHTYEGLEFRKFLQCFKTVYFHLPLYKQEVHIYGHPASAIWASHELLAQGTSCCTETKPNIPVSNEVRWNLLDFNDEIFSNDAAIQCYKDLIAQSTSESPNSIAWNGLRDFYFNAKSLHLWIKADRFSFDSYLKSTQMKLCKEQTEEPMKNVNMITDIWPVSHAADTDGCFSDNKDGDDNRNWWTNDAYCISLLEKCRGVSSIMLNPTNDDLDDEVANLNCMYCFTTFENTSDPQRYVLEACGHVICQDCVGRSIENAYWTYRIPATMSCCKKELTLADLNHICNIRRAVRIQSLLHCAVTKFVADNPHMYAVCSRVNCPGICMRSVNELSGEKPQMECLFCSAKTCFQCKGRSHGSTPCEDKTGLQDWMKADEINRKMCNSCHMGIEKDGGCNIIFCINCNNYICWECSEFFGDNAEEAQYHSDQVHGYFGAE